MKRKTAILSVMGGAWLVVFLLLTGGALASEGQDQQPLAWQSSPTVAEEKPFYLGMRVTFAGKPAAVQVGVRAAAGAAILRVEPNSPAQRAGLAVGDVIVRYGEYDVEDVEGLIAAISLSPRDRPQTLIFVRNNRRYQTGFTAAERPTAANLAWYSHPDGGYRVQLPVAWEMEKSGPAPANATVMWDVLLSADRLYRVDFVRRSTPAIAAASALEGFVRERQPYRQDAVAARMSVAQAPAIYIASYVGDAPRVAVYSIAFWHDRRLYGMEVTAPAISSLHELPFPVRHLLSRLQLSSVPSSRDGERVEPIEKTPPVPVPPPPTATAKPPELAVTSPRTSQKVTVPPPVEERRPPFTPPAGWVAVELADVRFFLPPGWQAVEGARSGEGMWRVGSGELPDASLALMRSQSAETYLAMLEGPTAKTITVDGNAAELTEGPLRSGAEPAWLRIVTIEPPHPLAEQLTCVFYARQDRWTEAAAEFDIVLRGLQYRPGSEVTTSAGGSLSDPGKGTQP